MRKVSFLIIAVLALSLIGAVVGCGEATPTATPVEPIKLGVLSDVSGPYAPYGNAHMEGAKVAVKLVNDAGGIKSLGGAMIEVVEGAGDSTVATAVTETERLITSEKVSCIFGPTASSEALACIPLFERYKVPGMNSLSDITQYQKGYRYQFTVVCSGQAEGKLMADFVEWLAKKHGAPTDRIAICYITPSYVAKAEGMIDRLKELGYGNNIVLEETFPASVTDQTPLVMKLKATNPSLVIYLGIGQDSVAFHKACYTYDYYPWMVMDENAYGATPVRDGLTAEIIEKNLLRPNVFGVGIGIGLDVLKDKIPSLKAFKDAFYQVYPNSTAAYPNLASGGWMTNVLIRAIENAGSRNGEDIANALRKLVIEAPDPYLVSGDAYPRFEMTESGIAATRTVMAEQLSLDLTEKQPIWPEDLASYEPRIQK